MVRTSNTVVSGKYDCQLLLAVAKAKTELDNEAGCSFGQVSFVALGCFRQIVQARQGFALSKPSTVPVVILTAGNTIVLTSSTDTAQFLGFPKPS
jgi:hypothetical protein